MIVNSAQEHYEMLNEYDAENFIDAVDWFKDNVVWGYGGKTFRDALNEIPIEHVEVYVQFLGNLFKGKDAVDVAHVSNVERRALAECLEEASSKLSRIDVRLEEAASYVYQVIERLEDLKRVLGSEESMKAFKSFVE